MEGDSRVGNRVWTGRWIEPAQEPVTEEPEFSLAQMFGGAPLPPQKPVAERLHPTRLLRRVFVTRTPVVRATLCCTARGLYQAFIDGRPVTDAVLLPGFTSYHKDLRYQEFDVTALFAKDGLHVWAAELADGWWAGRVAVQGQSAQWGDTLQYLGELELEYADGTREVIGTDDAFECAAGARTYADIQIGERHDFRREREGWAEPDYEAGYWKAQLKPVYAYRQAPNQRHERKRPEHACQNALVVHPKKGVRPVKAPQVVEVEHRKAVDRSYRHRRHPRAAVRFPQHVGHERDDGTERVVVELVVREHHLFEAAAKRGEHAERYEEGHGQHAGAEVAQRRGPLPKQQKRNGRC